MALGKRSSKGPLQEVLGQGGNVNADNPLEVHDPKVGSLISYEGVTTADGAADGSTLIDTVLTTKPDFNGNLVIITSGAYAGQGRDINGVTTAGTVTPTSAFGGQILRGTSFVIVALRLTPAEVAALAAALATHDVDIKALLATIAAYIDTEVAAILAAVDTEVAAIEVKLDTPANFMANVAALALEATLGTHDVDIKALLATIAGYLDTEIAAVITSQGRTLVLMPPFWSDPVKEKVVTAAQVTAAVGAAVVVHDIPAGATVVIAKILFKFRMVENTNVALNSLDLTAVQPIQVDDSVNTGWMTAMNFVDEQFELAASTSEGGDVLIGKVNVAARVDGNDTYDFQWLNAKAHLANIKFRDIQMGIQLAYSI